MRLGLLNKDRRSLTGLHGDKSRPSRHRKLELALGRHVAPVVTWAVTGHNHVRYGSLLKRPVLRLLIIISL